MTFRENEKREVAIAKVLAFHKPDPATTAEVITQHGHLHDGNQGSAELALFLADNGLDLDEALAEAEKTYATYRNIHVEDALAWCHYRKGNHRKARLMIERAMKWDTRDPSMLFHRGMIHLALDDQVLGKKYLEEALALNPNFDPIDAAIAKKTIKEINGKKRRLNAGGQ